MQAIDPRQYSKAEQMAYWINLYNALTVNLILEEYPVGSISEISASDSFGPWNDFIAEVSEQSLTLNDIEHRILRPIWKDDRIHFAVNCASIGCPNLQPHAFTAENTEALLSKGAQEFVSHSRGVRFKDKSLVLSSIFDWYGNDFGDTKKQQLEKLAEYAPSDTAEKLRNYQGAINYQYDWNLNSSD